MKSTISGTVLILLASSAQAGIPGFDTFDDRTAFNNATGPTTLEDFESEALGDVGLPTVFDSDLVVGLTSGSVTAYIDAADANGFLNTVGDRKYLAFGRNFASGGPQTGSYTVEFSFAGSVVNSFGFDLSGFQPDLAANGFNVTTFNSGQIVDDFFFPAAQDFGTAEFYGFIADNAFDAFRVNIPTLATAADYVAFDGVVWGVPAPGALSLLAVAGLTGARRRR